MTTEACPFGSHRAGGGLPQPAERLDASMRLWPAEGVGRDVEMLIGNGYTEGWLDTAFRLYREHPPLAEWLRRRFGA